jgi:sulfate adenylyltransferase subunit 2
LNAALSTPARAAFCSANPPDFALPSRDWTHLDALEAESVFILREVAAQCSNVALLFSGGKDSAVVLRLAERAFFPEKIPFTLLHVDTEHNFPEVIAFRDRVVDERGHRLVVRSVGDSIRTGRVRLRRDDEPRNPHQSVTLLDAIAEFGFDACIGGARRDEEKARAKERVFSFRDEFGQWDPKNQRPELWSLYNGRVHKGENVRVFPISNWTELDVWQYIQLEGIDIVPLYLAAPRPTVERDGLLLMVDDERFPLEPGETPVMRSIRFRTLGCYPLTGAVESEADTLPAIIREMLLTKTSERQGRVIDHDSAASMEKKKQEGYF